METDKIIEVKSLTKKYKSLTAVNNLELNVYHGDVFGFLGPNGAGKSTTIRMLLSLIKPTSGSIKIFNKSLTAHRNEILKNVGAIVEKADFYLYLSAYQNLEILSRISGSEVPKNRIMEVLELVGLKERYKSKVKTFSHGMKQRLGIAQALIHDPQLIILDEPTTGLDPQGMKEIRDLIIHLSRNENKTIFLSSHILHEVELIATRMIIISKGKTCVEGTVDELLDADSLNVTFEVDDISRAMDLIKHSGWNNDLIKTEKNRLILKMKENEISELNKYLINDSIAVSAIIPTRSLEDYFLKITEGGE